jgi:hypothetical protein
VLAQVAKDAAEETRKQNAARIAARKASEAAQRQRDELLMKHTIEWVWLIRHCG